MNKIELLAPAGNLEKCKIALLFGADAVYIGGLKFGLRAFSDNFTIEEMEAAVAFAHELQKKIYVTVNIVPTNEDLKELPDYLRELARIKVDALIISDLGVWNIARKVVPEMELHVSTQANTSNWAAVELWQELGAKRVVLARELSLQDIQGIRAKSSMELEVFVHGAMCISFSGRCLLSNYMAGRDANKGACVQACRWKYHLVEETRPQELFPVFEDDRGTYILNSKDLCLIDKIPELVAGGVNSFKIEGRMKSIHYVATVVSVYRQALDSYYADPENYCVREEWLTELDKASHRIFTKGFIEGKENTKDAQIYNTSAYEQSHDFVGVALDYDNLHQRVLLEQRNNVKVGEEAEFLEPNGNIVPLLLQDMKNEKNESIEVAPHAKQIFSVFCATPISKHSLLRRKAKNISRG